MENDIFDSLEDLRYSGPLVEEKAFEDAMTKGPISVEYTQLVEWATKELRNIYGLEENINAISNPDDSETFLMEMSGFLREYGCPYSCLSDGPISQRLSTRQSRLVLLDFLLTELSAARMTAVNKPDLVKKTMEVEPSAESEIAKYMKQMLIALGFPKPPAGITAFQLFSKVEQKVKELISKIPSDHMSKPLLKARLSDKQWDGVMFINQALTQEYDCRREMLLKRFDVTMQSFRWSERAKAKEDQITTVLQPVRRNLCGKSSVDVHQILAAREDLLKIEKTSSGLTREKSKTPLNRVKIGHVPDRGGRAYEHEVPPPEMPSFQKRQNAPPQQQRQGGDRRGGRGGRGGDHRGGDHRGGRGGSDHRGGHSGGGGGWSQGAPQYAAPQQNMSAGQAFFGGGGGYQTQPYGYQGQYDQQNYYQQSYEDYGQSQQRGYQNYGQQYGDGGYQQGGSGAYHQQGGGYQQGGGQRGGRGRGRDRGRGGRR